MESYKNLSVYKQAPKSLKKAIEAYITANKPSNDQMYLQLQMYQQKHLSKKEKRATNSTTSLVVLFVCIVLLLGIQFVNNIVVVILCAVGLLAILVMYLLGMFADYKFQIRKIKKQLANLPEIPEFTGLEK